MTFLIRHAEPADVEAIVRIHAQPRAVRGTLQVPYPSVELWKKRLAAETPNARHLVACEGAEPVGFLGLWQPGRSPRRRHVAAIGMAVHDDWQRKGVGTVLTREAIELADNWLNVIRIELTVYTDNEPAIALYRKFGFRTEGTHQKYAFRDGQYVDAYAMARIRENYGDSIVNSQR